ncbi:hypothetical protein Daura_14755 [Dactylosporangium aurantiacum]|uniref:Uncharacterized protein n=1 Tax=Dactylosporangium aurantiacum TaxID=35754 RepID=A0A9Q9MQ78_9ACTN|nr:hypothetical protein [Dactylosporangium aurantiacum]MDG6108512.1 hypothetical protein [Dactylosporangium aurantiacum]UWZ57312.1 hypothetical protein Daura_14755 [Dactylosporangium aurantiacum]
MGLFGDLRRLNQQARAIDANYDPAAQMRAGMAAMQQAQHSMQAQTADLQLEQTGTPGAATILALVDTGTRINMVPLVRLNLLVEVNGMPPYPVTVESMLPLHASAQAGIGQRVSVKVDPHRAERVLVRWGMPV